MHCFKALFQAQERRLEVAVGEGCDRNRQRQRNCIDEQPRMQPNEGNAMGRDVRQQQTTFMEDIQAVGDFSKILQRSDGRQAGP